jgi:hypothetical protein
MDSSFTNTNLYGKHKKTRRSKKKSRTQARELDSPSTTKPSALLKLSRPVESTAILESDNGHKRTVEPLQPETPPQKQEHSGFEQFPNALQEEHRNSEKVDGLCKHPSTYLHGTGASALDLTAEDYTDQVLEVSNLQAPTSLPSTKQECNPFSNISTLLLSNPIVLQSACFEDEKWAYTQGRRVYMRWKVKQANIAHEADMKAVKESEPVVRKRTKETRFTVDNDTLAPARRLEESTNIRNSSHPAYTRQQPTPSPEKEDVEKSGLNLRLNMQTTLPLDLRLSDKTKQAPLKTSLDTLLLNQDHENREASLISPPISDELNPLSNHNLIGFSTTTKGSKPCGTPNISLRYVELTLAEYQKQYDLPRRNGLSHKERMELAADHSVVFMANALREAKLVPEPAAFEKALSEVIVRFHQRNSGVKRRLKRSSTNCASPSSDQGSVGNSATGFLASSATAKRVKASKTTFRQPHCNYSLDIPLSSPTARTSKTQRLGHLSSARNSPVSPEQPPISPWSWKA